MNKRRTAKRAESRECPILCVRTAVWSADRSSAEQPQSQSTQHSFFFFLSLVRVPQYHSRGCPERGHRLQDARTAQKGWGAARCVQTQLPSHVAVLAAQPLHCGRHVAPDDTPWSPRVAPDDTPWSPRVAPGDVANEAPTRTHSAWREPPARQQAAGSGQRAADSGLWAVGCGLWAAGSGLWAVGCGLWAVGCGLWAD